MHALPEETYIASAASGTKSMRASQLYGFIVLVASCLELGANWSLAGKRSPSAATVEDTIWQSVDAVLEAAAKNATFPGQAMKLGLPPKAVVCFLGQFA